MDGFLDEIIRAARAGGDADRQMLAGGEPVGGCDFAFGVDVEMADRCGGLDAIGVAEEIGPEIFFADFDQVRGVRAVVAADDEKEV